MITLFAELSGFRTDYRISIKLSDFIVILGDIVLFAECLESSYSALVIKNSGIIITGIRSSVTLHELRNRWISVNHFHSRIFINIPFKSFY